MENFFRSICLFLVASSIFSSDAYSVRSQAAQLARLKEYEIVTPRRLDGRQRRDVDTLTENGHLREPSFTILIDGEELILDLFLNDVLFADGFLERTYSENRIPITSPPRKAHHCYYQGGIRGHNSSKVAISTCNGLSGVIWFNGETFYIEPLKESEHDHLIFRAENVVREKPFFTYEEHYPPQFFQDGEERMQKMKEVTGGRQRRDVQSEMKYIELILVADRAEFEKLGSSEKVIEKCKKVANIMDATYQGLLNTRVALVLVEVWNTQDGFVVSTNPSQTLNLFQSWRRRNLVEKARHDNAQLITGVNFDGSTVGMAGVGTMCSLDDSCGVSMDHGDQPGDLASTICHELGHNLGLLHDDETCACTGPTRVGCVMASSSGSTPPTNWSSCSEERYSDNLNTGLGACMFNYPEVIFDGPSCGNGFIEEDEECDCGLPEDCKNPCCVAETCTLHVNATCAIGECCLDCQLKERGTLCRSMVNECDLPEYCTGDHEECPSNVYRQNGVLCTTQESDAASCYDGRCVSYDDQCRSIWGDGAKKSHDRCWQYNTQGDSFGNCGRDPSGSLRKCSGKDRFCGKLYCQGGKSFPLIGNLATAQRAVIGTHECKAASVDQGKDVPDPGYVATGSVCGEAMICHEFACVNYSMANIVPCKYNCHDQGICNSNNNCHCDDAWNPPFCQYPGSGGSIDSGPANANQDDGGRPKSRGLLMIILLVVLIPAFVIGIIVAIWKRDIIKDKLMTARSQFGRPDTDPKGRYAQVKKPATAGYIYRPQRPPPPKPTAKSTALSQPRTDNSNKYRWPDEPAAPPSKPAPLRPVYTNNYKADNGVPQPSVAVIQPRKPLSKPPLKPTPMSKPSPPSKPSPVAAQRAALKPVGARPPIPKRPVSSAGPQNNNWNNSKNVLQPGRTAPAPPKK